jgi:competence protein ComEA
MVGTISRRSADGRATGAPAQSPGEPVAAYWQAWAPVLARMAATGLALLGLAGIGWAARGSGELAALSTAPLSFGLAQLAGSGVGAVTAATLAASAAPPAPRPSAPCPRAAAAPERPAPPAPVATATALSADGRVILNLAGPAELQRLPGVGAKRAAAIVELRQRLRRFRRLSDLLRIKGIGPRTLERMLPMLVLDADARS